MSGLVLARYELRDNDWRLSLGNRIVLMRRIWAEMQKSSYRLRETITGLRFVLKPRELQQRQLAYQHAKPLLANSAAKLPYRRSMTSRI